MSKTINEDIKSKIQKHGYSTDNVHITDKGYIVEGDIFVTDADLNKTPSSSVYAFGPNKAQEEHYCVNERVNSTGQFDPSGLNRFFVPVMIDPILAGAENPWSLNTWRLGVYDAINRYGDSNTAFGIQFHFVAWGTYPPNTPGTITIRPGSLPNGVWASAGPPSNGRPFSSITVNQNMLGAEGQYTIASVLSHEMGHCIGFRHTDYMNRSYSCGSGTPNESVGPDGANYIGFTPTDPSPNSWMLACIGSGMNRPFTETDKRALRIMFPCPTGDCSYTYWSN